MILMNGKKLQVKIMNNLKQEVEALRLKNIIPHLVIIQVGNNPSSNIYIKHKQKSCNVLGIKSTNLSLPETSAFNDLKEAINKLNNDELVHGILVQFPLPKHISKREVSMLIDPSKDVDGIHPLHQGMLITNVKQFYPKTCTPQGIMELLNEYNIQIKGKKVVVIGRSNIAGRPMSNMLINADATLSLLHSHSSNQIKKSLLSNADIIVTATGSKDVFTHEDVKKDVVIIDVGIIKHEDNKIRGDIDYKTFANKASYITPVPGGVGPMTVAMLMKNIVDLIKHKK